MSRITYIIIGAIIGLLAGFFLFPWIECLSGTCPITSNSTIVTFLGGFIGYAVADSIYDFVKKRNKDS